jgi:glucosamine--fructose-6-phosphate aminotransferase (isomerizing)
MTLHTEIHEQPDRLANLLTSQRRNVEEIARVIQTKDLRYVFLAARGTSDNAGRYANYLWGARNGLPMALATPSLFTYYHQPPNLRDALVVGISQSGVSPDIISVVEEGKRRGCPTLAITNDPASPLAQIADAVIDIHAGPELAVAATKTYTGELLAVAMLSAALAGSEDQWRELELVPAWVQQVLAEDEAIAQMCQRYRYMQHCVVLGRGYNYATAFEWALKLKELTYINAEPYSSADFQHGPVAVVDRGFPVLAVIPQGKVFDSSLSLLRLLSSEALAELVVISDSAQALGLAKSQMPLPAGIPEWITPLVSIVPAQLFSHHLTIARGYDAEKPRNIRKVTETR